MNKKTLIITGIVVAVGIGGYFLYKKWSENRQEDQGDNLQGRQQSPEASASPVIQTKPATTTSPTASTTIQGTNIVTKR